MNGSGPLYDELHRAVRGGGRAAAGAPLPRPAPDAPARARRAAPADRLDALRPRARARLRGGRRGGRRRHVRRGRAVPREVLASAAGRGAAADRRAEHVRDRAVARAPDDPAQAARRRRPVPGARVGELRHHRGRLHRLPRPLRRRAVGPGRARRAPAAEPLPLPRLRDGRLEPPARPAPRLGRPAGRVPVVGRRPRSRRALERAFWRRFDVDVLDVDPRRVRRAPRSGGSRPSRERRRRPYKGLAAFEDSELDALFFFGRERDTEIVVANLIASRLTVLYGPSGVGKSSLLLAAVARSLRELPEAAARRRLLELERRPRRGARRAPSPTLAGIEAGDAASTRSSARRPARDVYLILDQAEEYFTLPRRRRGPVVRRGARRDRRPAAARQRARSRCARTRSRSSTGFKGRIPSLFANVLRLDRLDRAAGRAAIVAPARALERARRASRSSPRTRSSSACSTRSARAGSSSAPGGLGVVEENGGAARIEAPYLQLVMQRLWEVERARGVVDAARRDARASSAARGRSSPTTSSGRSTALTPGAAGRSPRGSSTTSSRRRARRSRTRRPTSPSSPVRRAAELDAGPRRRSPSHRILRTDESGPRGRSSTTCSPAPCSAGRPATTPSGRSSAPARRRGAGIAGSALLAFGALVGLALASALAVFAFSQRSDARDQARDRAGAGSSSRARCRCSTAIPSSGSRSPSRPPGVDPAPRAEDALRQALRRLARARRSIDVGSPARRRVELRPLRARRRWWSTRTARRPD